MTMKKKKLAFERTRQLENRTLGFPPDKKHKRENDDNKKEEERIVSENRKVMSLLTIRFGIRMVPTSLKETTKASM